MRVSIWWIVMLMQNSMIANINKFRSCSKSLNALRFLEEKKNSGASSTLQPCHNCRTYSSSQLSHALDHGFGVLWHVRRKENKRRLVFNNEERSTSMCRVEPKQIKSGIITEWKSQLLWSWMTHTYTHCASFINLLVNLCVNVFGSQIELKIPARLKSVNTQLINHQAHSQHSWILFSHTHKTP